MNKEFKLPEGFEDAKVVEETPVEQERTFEGDMKFCFSYIDNVMQLPEKPTRAPGKDGQPGEMLDPTPKREKYRMCCDKVRQVMKRWGKFYNVGHVTTYVPDHTRQNIQIIRDDQTFTEFLRPFGLLAGDTVTTMIAKDLGSYADQCESKIIYLMSHYDPQRHVLYVNEYNGNFLKLDGDGKVTRLRNGDEGMLFEWGVGKFDPLCADLFFANLWTLGSALNPNGGVGEMLIRDEILDVVKYADDGLGRDNAHLLLMGCLLALYFQERIKAVPLVCFTGLGGSMKSALVKRVGKLIVGHKFEMTDCPEGMNAIAQLKDLAISMPFIGLDEANRIGDLSNILKTIATGGADTRRRLYTTSTMETKPYQARLWMTMNTGDPREETVASRMLIFDAAKPEGKAPYRATIHLEWSAEKRNALWTELVGRLAMAMQRLKIAEERGKADAKVTHRMSDFFVFLTALAEGEATPNELPQYHLPTRVKKAMEATESRQQTAISDALEIVDVLTRASHTLNGQMMTAKEWGAALEKFTGEHDEVRRSLRKKNWVAWTFKANERLLEERFGMTKQIDSHRKLTFFSFSKLSGNPAYVEEPEG